MPDYCFPFRLAAENLPTSTEKEYKETINNLNMFMFPRTVDNMSFKCFIMTLSCDDTYQAHEDDDSLLSKINPNRILHCICLRTLDFIESVGLFLN